MGYRHANLKPRKIKGMLTQVLKMKESLLNKATHYGSHYDREYNRLVDQVTKELAAMYMSGDIHVGIKLVSRKLFNFTYDGHRLPFILHKDDFVGLETPLI